MLKKIEADVSETLDKKIVSPNEPHLACVLLLDTSGSMSSNGGAPIASLNKAVKAFKEKICLDAVACNRVDIAVIEFNCTARLIQDFVPISTFEPEELLASGMTAMGEAINLALDKLTERRRFYHELNTPCFKPWVFMITDGEPTDNLESSKERLEVEYEKQRLEFWALGVNGYNKDTLRSMTKNSMALEYADFSDIFDWFSKSVITRSKSRVEEKITLPELPEDTFLLDENW